MRIVGDDALFHVEVLTAKNASITATTSKGRPRFRQDPARFPQAAALSGATLMLRMAIGTESGIRCISDITAKAIGIYKHHGSFLTTTLYAEAYTPIDNGEISRKEVRF
jgi:hypothetical protein